MHRPPEGHNHGWVWVWGVCMVLVPLCSFLSQNEAENTFHRLLMHRLEMDYKYTRLDCCNALLAGLPSNNQTSTNASECSGMVFNEPKRTHVTPLLISLHWLPVAAHIKFKTLMLAYRTTTGSALLPLTITNLHPLQKSEIC